MEIKNHSRQDVCNLFNNVHPKRNSTIRLYIDLQRSVDRTLRVTESLARSPNVSRLDCYLWNDLKSQVYKETRNWQDVEVRNKHEIQEILPNWLQNSLRNFCDTLGVIVEL